MDSFREWAEAHFGPFCPHCCCNNRTGPCDWYGSIKCALTKKFGRRATNILNQVALPELCQCGCHSIVDRPAMHDGLSKTGAPLPSTVYPSLEHGPSPVPWIGLLRLGTPLDTIFSKKEKWRLMPMKNIAGLVTEWVNERV